MQSFRFSGGVRGTRIPRPVADGRDQRSHRGFTLLEVVVGLALMATLLVSSLLAFSAHRRQRNTADAKLAAVAIADDLLEAFSSQLEGIPRVGRGAIAGRPGWYWRTSIVGTAAPAQIAMQVIRLEVARITPEGDPQVLATVEVVKSITPGEVRS